MSEWRKHPVWQEYEVSDGGEIRSIYTMRPLVGKLDKDGYRSLILCTGADESAHELLRWCWKHG